MTHKLWVLHQEFFRTNNRVPPWVINPKCIGTNMSAPTRVIFVPFVQSGAVIFVLEHSCLLRSTRFKSEIVIVEFSCFLRNTLNGAIITVPLTV